MAHRIDPAILNALDLDAASTTIASHGSSGFASTYKLTAKSKDKAEKLYFVKTGKGKDSEIMFAGEHASLNAIHNAVPSFCPRSYAHGQLSSSKGSFLLTDFLDLTSSSSSSHSSSRRPEEAASPTPAGSGKSLAQKLAQLHSTPAPVPAGYDEPQFGFPVPTCCGDTVQENSYKSSWADFYADNRLRHVLASGERKHGVDREMRALVEQTASVVVPRLLREGHLTSPEGRKIQPVVVHGDLWSGNHGRGSIAGGAREEVVFDAAACYGHSEFEFGIMRMFGGGFGGAFEREYEKCKGKDEPVAEWEDRVLLYELYHHLNHYSIFGGGYKSGALSIMKRLINKYGKGSDV